MDCKKCLQFLNTFNNFEKLSKPKKSRFFELGRMRSCLASLGNPEQTFRSVLVGGSKGKGSTAFYLAESLRSCGYRVGLYTSPHLHDVRERIAFNGIPISKSDFARLSTQLVTVTKGDSHQNVTYFEWLTLLAFLYFLEKKVDIAILEVGLGGRLDATNVVDPLLTVITPISLEHTRILGNTLAKIASEKSFLIHSGRPAVLAEQEKSARAVLLKRAKECKSRIFEEGRAFSAERFHIPLDKKPLFARQNMALSLQALCILKKQYGFRKISSQKALRIFRAKQWPGRFEIVQKKPIVLVDGAHNPASARKLVESIRYHYSDRKIILILGVAQDKDVCGIIRELSALKPSCIIVTQFKGSRALDGALLMKMIKNVENQPSLNKALRLAERRSKPNDLILVTGSLYLAAEARKYYGKA